MIETLQAGTQVCLKTAPDRRGRVTGKVHERAGRVRYEIDFGDCREYIASGNFMNEENNGRFLYRSANGRQSYIMPGAHSLLRSRSVAPASVMSMAG